MDFKVASPCAAAELLSDEKTVERLLVTSSARTKWVEKSATKSAADRARVNEAEEERIVVIDLAGTSAEVGGKSTKFAAGIHRPQTRS